MHLPTLVGLLSSLALQMPPTDSTDAILLKASNAYQQLTALKSEFVQRIEIPALERTEEGRGIVYQRKPHYFLMKFEEPKGDIVVADGNWFWMYYPSAHPDQVVRTAIDRSAEGANLGGQFVVNPTERYVPTYVKIENVGDRPAHLISLVPKFDAPYTLVRVWVDARDYLVRKFEVHEENDTVRTLTLSNVAAGVDLPESLFQFSPPEGVEVFTR